MEVEAKFIVVNPETVDIHDLKDMIEQGGYRVKCSTAPIRIEDTYFDTDHHELNEVGAAIRAWRKKENQGMPPWF